LEPPRAGLYSLYECWEAKGCPGMEPELSLWLLL
jgi:hypothetical protein